MRWIAVIAFLFAPTWAISNVSELSFDENDRLTTNYVLFVDNPSCQLDHDAYPYRPALPMSANLMSEFFEDSESIGDCAVVCLEKGVLKEHVVHPLPMHVGKQLESAANFVQANCAKTEVGFLSYNPNVADIFWVNGNKRQKVGTLKQGEKNTVWQVSYLGHKFLIEDTVTKEKLLELTVTHNAIYPIGDHKSARQVRDVERGVQDTFQMEWHRAHRVTRTFTPYGFNKGRLPLDLWGSISAYYYNNRDNRILEEWDSKGLYVNWWEVDVFFIPMAYELKKVWQARIKELVEAWTGVDLETTDIYGMRRYEDGARLLTHVDREATHAASVIMNIAQNAIRTPWKVEIYDFANNLHEIEMDPGDIVYYESARCLHGRMQPLDGGYYVNLFAHYRPNGDPQWFSRSNPEGTPKQILDIGECSSDGIKATCTKEDVPYLSPKLEKLKGPDDLFRFWKETAPKTHSVGSKDEL